jgi:hypothetical protein
MRISQVIEEVVVQRQVLDEIDDLRSDVDSTNKLLVDILTVLRELVKRK